MDVRESIFQPGSLTTHVAQFISSELSSYFCEIAVNLLFINVLGAFAKLRKATISSFMSVCLSVRSNNSAHTGRISIKFGILNLSKICLGNSSFTKIWQV
jgi:hypothetical protein